MSNTDPELKRLNRVRVIYIIFAVIMLILFVILVVASMLDHSNSSVPVSSHFVNLGLALASLLLSFASISLVTRYYKKAQQQRITAVQGGVPGPIAEEQPVASTASLTLPFTLRFHANWRYFFLLLFLPIVLILVIGFVFFYVFALNTTPALSARGATIFLAIFGGFLLLFLIAFGVAVFFAVRRLRQYIEVSETGVKGLFLGRESDLRWDEIKLFALWGGKSKVQYAYEVAGERGMVRWSVPVKNRWYCPIVSTLPFGEYYPQMQDVLALISAKTDLPLRDLRLKWYGGEQKQNREQKQVSHI